MVCGRNPWSGLENVWQIEVLDGLCGGRLGGSECVRWHSYGLRNGDSFAWIEH